MAQKKRKSAASSKKTTKKPASKRPVSKKTAEKVNRSKRQMTAVILFAVGILLTAIAIIPGTNVWLWCHNFLFGLCGLAFIAVPASIIYVAVMETLDRPTKEIRNRVWQVSALVLLISALIEMCQTVPYSGTDFFNVLTNLYDDAVGLLGGGVISAILGWPLYAACGRVGAIIIIALVLFAFVMLLTGSTLIGLFRSVAKPVKRMEEAYIARREEQDDEEDEEEEKKFNINVDLGPEAKPKKEKEPAPKPAIQELLEAEKARAEEEICAAKEARAQRKKTEEAVPPPAISVIGEVEAPDSVAENAPAVPEMQEEIPMPTEEPPMPEVTAFEEIPIEDFEIIDEEELETPEHKAAQELVEKAFAANANNQKAETLIEENGQSKLDMPEKPKETYVYPPIGLLRAPKSTGNVDVSSEQNRNAQRLVETLDSFGVHVKILNISRGPSVTRYELQPSAGVKISRITGLADDIAMNLAASGVRIEAPIPGKPAVGIEVPNRQTDMVTMREIIDTADFDHAKSKLSVALGRDIAGNCVIADIGKMPHMLIAGATGSGKSVCINSIIISLLYKAAPSEVRFLMIDPKVVELGVYNGIPHLLVPVVTDPRKAAGALGWAVTEMMKRYALFAENNVRDLEGYNNLAEERGNMEKMPQVVIIIDELSDLMMAAPTEVEDSICRLAQMARAAGMHLIIATQRPSVDVVTGLIKANVPSRIAFAVSSQIDSRTILDSGGAEKLLGKGDMLFSPVGMPKPKRVQGCYVSDKEVEQVVSFVKNKESASYDDKILEEIEKQAVAEKSKGGSSDNSGGGFDEVDALLGEAIQCVVEAGQASTSFLQRKLRVGYARAARLVDEMEEKGIVGPPDGSKPRQVLITRQQWIEMRMNEDASASGEAAHE